MANEYHVQMRKIVDGNAEKVYPINKVSDVQLEGKANLPQGAETLDDVIGALGSMAFQNSITINPGTTESAGVVKLSNVIDDKTATTTAATTSAVSTVADNAVNKTGDQEISGVKTFKDDVVLGNATLKFEKTADTNTLTIDFSE